MNHGWNRTILAAFFQDPETTYETGTNDIALSCFTPCHVQRRELLEMMNAQTMTEDRAAEHASAAGDEERQQLDATLIRVKLELNAAQEALDEATAEARRWEAVAQEGASDMANAVDRAEALTVELSRLQTSLEEVCPDA